MIGKGLDCLFPIYRPIDLDKKKYLRVRCGKCFNCRKAHAREWSFRLACESRDWKNSCFVTLTYDDEHVPKNVIGTGVVDNEIPLELLTLCKRDVQLFIKKLRKQLGFKIKYFCAGEYGSKTHRPHYHLIIFGLSEDFKHIINSCWQKGFIEVGDVCEASIQYVAGYCEKKLFYDENNPFIVRESLNCSQHLGERYFFEKYFDYVDDEHQSIRWGEYFYPIPRTFRKKLVALGKLSEQSQEMIYEKQKIDIYQLGKFLDSQNVSLSDFFKQRTKNAVSSHFSRVNARDKI